MVVLVCACGRTEHNDAAVAGGVPQAGATSHTPSQAGAASDTPSSDVGPIDADGQPERLAVCAGRSDALALQLPCSVGLNIAGPLDQPGQHVVECELLGTVEADAISFVLPLADVPELLNEPVPLPFDGTLSAPVGPGAGGGDQHVVGTLSGLFTFTQVDIADRAFVATLEHGVLDWSGDTQGFYTCTTIDGPLWAIAGDFL